VRTQQLIQNNFLLEGLSELGEMVRKRLHDLWVMVRKRLPDLLAMVRETA